MDGKIHNSPIKRLEDKSKDQSLKDYGIYVQRFSNEEVILDLENVVSKIRTTINRLENDLTSPAQ